MLEHEKDVSEKWIQKTRVDLGAMKPQLLNGVVEMAGSKVYEEKLKALAAEQAANYK